jgi:hypothetical protein
MSIAHRHPAPCPAHPAVIGSGCHRAQRLTDSLILSSPPPDTTNGIGFSRLCFCGANAADRARPAR